MRSSCPSSCMPRVAHQASVFCSHLSPFSEPRHLLAAAWTSRSECHLDDLVKALAPDPILELRHGRDGVLSGQMEDVDVVRSDPLIWKVEHEQPAHGSVSGI